MTARVGWPDAEPADDERLVRAARSGDTDAFRQLYQRYARRLYAFFLGYTADSALAEELVNDAFVRVWRALPRYREEGHFRAWLFRIARNVATDAHRRQKRHPPQVPLEDLERWPVGDTEPLEQSERLARVQAMLRTLPEDYRLVLLLRFVEGLSAPEIAQIMGRSPEAVRVLQFRALRLLRQRLDTTDGTAT